MDEQKLFRLLRTLAVRSIELEAQLLALRGVLTVKRVITDTDFGTAIEAARQRVRATYSMPSDPQEVSATFLDDLLRKFEGPIQ